MGSNPTGQATTCAAAPCIDPQFAALGGPTAPSVYWSASALAFNPGLAWDAFFNLGEISNADKTLDFFVRAVRAGSCCS
jgi:acyl-CoA reductase-like NAD-dependent aldehyde dehydrogenase